MQSKRSIITGVFWRCIIGVPLCQAILFIEAFSHRIIRNAILSILIGLNTSWGILYPASIINFTIGCALSLSLLFSMFQNTNEADDTNYWLQWARVMHLYVVPVCIVIAVMGFIYINVIFGIDDTKVWNLVTGTLLCMMLAVDGYIKILSDEWDKKELLLSCPESRYGRS